MKYNQFFQIDETKLSKSEFQVHNFILDNTSSILDMNITELEAQTFLSRATIERYLKKAGTDGFKTYKIKLNEFLVFNQAPLTYDTITNLLLQYQNKRIGITAQGTSYLAAQYFNRRLKYLKFNSTAETFLDLNGVQPDYDLLIIISIRGMQYEGLTDIIEHYNVPLVGITKPGTYLYNCADYPIDNKTNNSLNPIDIDDISSTINIIEEIIRDLARTIN